MSDLKCPYCGADNEVCHDGGAGYDEDITHQMQCCECEKYFTFTTYISYSYTPAKADCLNDGQHQWQSARITPYWPEHRNYARMRCILCDEERRMTEDEWQENQKL